MYMCLIHDLSLIVCSCIFLLCIPYTTCPVFCAFHVLCFPYVCVTRFIMEYLVTLQYTGPSCIRGLACERVYGDMVMCFITYILKLSIQLHCHYIRLQSV
jgi:hypothetical protein